MVKRITLVTSGHLSSCPRLIKEAKYFLSLGHKVNVVSIESIDRIYQKDIELSKSLMWEVKMINWNGKGLNTLIFKTLSILVYYISNFINKHSRFFQKNTYWLYREVSKLESDLIIAHQFNSFMAVSLMKKHFKFVYDVEDAYAFMEKGATIDNFNSKIKSLEEKYIRNIDVILYSSPLYKQLYESIYNINTSSEIIYNVFNVYSKPTSDYEFTDRVDLSKIGIYWFSQTIGLDRGIQQFLSILDQLNLTNWEVHLRGAHTSNVKNQILKSLQHQYSRENIYFHQPVSIDELIYKNKEYDIGLALEDTSSLNRDYCISNKLFDYMSAGLSIIYSNTKGQTSILGNYNDYFLEYNEKDLDNFKLKLSELLTNKEFLMKSKIKSRELSTIYNIQVEQLKYNFLLS